MQTNKEDGVISVDIQMAEQEDASKSEAMRTQVFFLLVRLFLFFAIIGIFLLILFGIAHQRTSFGGDSKNHPAIEQQSSQPE